MINIIPKKYGIMLVDNRIRDSVTLLLKRVCKNRFIIVDDKKEMFFM